MLPVVIVTTLVVVVIVSDPSIVHPLYVPVTVYVPHVFTVMLAVVSPLLHT